MTNAMGKDLLTLDVLFQLMKSKNASDLHLTVGVPPILRIDGKLFQTPYNALTSERIQIYIIAAFFAHCNQKSLPKSQFSLFSPQKSRAARRRHGFFLNLYAPTRCINSRIRA